MSCYKCCPLLRQQGLLDHIKNSLRNVGGLNAFDVVHHSLEGDVHRFVQSSLHSSHPCLDAKTQPNRTSRIYSVVHGGIQLLEICAILAAFAGSANVWLLCNGMRKQIPRIHTLPPVGLTAYQSPRLASGGAICISTS